MKTKILQSIANKIVDEMSKDISDEKFNSLYDLGIRYNEICINVFGVYLD